MRRERCRNGVVGLGRVELVIGAPVSPMRRCGRRIQGHEVLAAPSNASRELPVGATDLEAPSEPEANQLGHVVEAALLGQGAAEPPRVKVGRSSEHRLEELWTAAIASRQFPADEFELLLEVFVIDASVCTHGLGPDPGGLRRERDGDQRAHGPVMSVWQGSEHDERLATRNMGPVRQLNVLGTQHHKDWPSVDGRGPPDGSVSTRTSTPGLANPPSRPPAAVRLQTGRDGEGASTADRGAPMPTTPAKNKKLTTSSLKAKKTAAVATDGARSVNREVATSAVKQERPVKAPRKATPGGAVADAERARAAGIVQEPPPANPGTDAIAPAWAQSGDRLTTAQGLRVDDADNSLTVGERGPSVLDDFHLRERIMHFDHERIPERVVHARGAGAHGVFEATEGLDDLCGAAFLRAGVRTPVFVRFSTVAGSRGSADTARDVRGFATKFYTEEGNFDLVGNNMPVFFIQDGIKFPDFVHAVKPEPDREIPQAQSAHDTFWDFVSLQPESTHMLMWVMSDRAIPRSFATMEGFGVHTFRLVAEDGSTSLVKWHWKPVAGIHGLVWEESQKLGGIDPDFHRRDLHARIASGALPQWDLAVQVMPDTEDQTFQGIDLLDSTKLIPEELCPIRVIGRMTLDRNPTNYFAETEQEAFHPGHLVPGIDIVDDPLLHARLFSYLDTQLTRLGGPNFGQLPINRPVAPVNDNNRDGFAQQAVHEGAVAYTPNSLGGGCPFAHPGAGTYTHVPREVAGATVKLRPSSFDDHFSQATMFYRSLTAVEQEHVAGAFSFELGKCVSPGVHARMVANLAQVDAELAAAVAAHLGIASPAASVDDGLTSPALSMDRGPDGSLAGRQVAVLVTDATPKRTISAWRATAEAEGFELVAVGPHFGTLVKGVAVDRSLHITQPVEYDAVVLAGEPDEAMAAFVQEAYRHHKTVAMTNPAFGAALGIDPASPGVVKTTEEFVEALSAHRHWDR